MYTLTFKPHDPECPATIQFNTADEIGFVKEIIESLNAKTIFDIEIAHQGELIESITIKPTILNDNDNDNT